MQIWLRIENAVHMIGQSLLFREHCRRAAKVEVEGSPFIVFSTLASSGESVDWNKNIFKRIRGGDGGREFFAQKRVLCDIEIAKKKYLKSFHWLCMISSKSFLAHSTQISLWVVQHCHAIKQWAFLRFAPPKKTERHWLQSMIIFSEPMCDSSREVTSAGKKGNIILDFLPYLNFPFEWKEEIVVAGGGGANSASLFVIVVCCWRPKGEIRSIIALRLMSYVYALESARNGCSKIWETHQSTA